METFKRSGSFVAYRVEGEIPSNGDLELSMSLVAYRFRSIDAAADEQTSFGWVTAGDPTGDSFASDDMDLDGHVWLRMRVDQKKLPASRMQIERAAAERSLGRRLSVRERRELRADLEERLLPTMLPKTKFVDLLWTPGRGLLLAFTTSKSVREKIEQLIVRTFSVQIHPFDASLFANTKDRDPATLGEEFLSWLLFWAETEGGEHTISGHKNNTVGVAFDDYLRLGPASDEDSTQTFRQGTPTRSPEVAEGLRNRRPIQQARLIIGVRDGCWGVTLDGATMSFRSVTLPDDDPDLDAREQSKDRAHRFVWLEGLVESLFRQFLGDLGRRGDRLATEMARWAKERA